MKTLRKSGGFTLIEIMVVIVILGVLGALVVPNVLGRTGEARVKAAQVDLRAIETALDMYRMDNFVYPSSEQGLQALVSKPSGFPEAKNWTEPYLKKAPKDPWGNEYQYISPGSDGPYDLFSLGADGKPGGEGEAADIFAAEL
ncbi:type II secretion system major pseudopilin GspG [Microbulbifer thermotolerans]|uniref:Type II secretion system core protein G n=1 Tax=Microbulbifer thermotolerans TaxID=252514 RepID=A0A143HMU0_MICTH|nr:type II secretion system major pseudopilin GspG [Microbulbifer thermotolerans]AMX02592.1 type II secretion system protein GspG [Microbulbifer thermotolerans]MCX2779737.1 type II secretion system major pseudopilin GspG [Microbulbifer thermotolerans]MCX2782331.1 type II secretion system major pseudopilin GspG [Microbulbifer thermotolerans]MCX2794920.1 type II secretion system major pseudopilin GspG [Microbulbifer thermotolerans]MCX2800484.1 type II secretion system major pseudopilin GspG [Mic